MTPDEVPAELAEPAARAMHLEGAWCGVCEFDGWENCKECRETVLGYARHALAAVLPQYGATVLEEAANDWQTREWANVPRQADRVADRLGAAQHVCDWLRRSAARLRGTAREAT